VAEFSTSKAPALVTATIGGEPATVEAEAAADALAVTVAVAVGPPADPPHAASSARAAGTASSLPSRDGPGAREAEEPAGIT
jgi:hypothetical protein